MWSSHKFVPPASVTGDGRMAIYSVSLGLCYASLNLGIDADFTEFYRPLGTVASYHSRMYVVT